MVTFAGQFYIFSCYSTVGMGSSDYCDLGKMHGYLCWTILHIQLLFHSGHVQ